MAIILQQKELNQEACYLDKNQIDVTQNMNILGVNFIHMVTLRHLVKGKELLV